MESDSEEYVPKAKIQKRSVGTSICNTCAIHDTNVTSKLITPHSYESWATLLHAAKIRQHDNVLKLAQGVEGNAIPTVYYHRKCRSKFTNSKLLSEIIETQQTRDRKDPLLATRERRVGCPPILLVVKCIFCNQVYKYKNKTRENLTQCCETRAADSIKQNAIKKSDSTILGLLNNYDLIASEAHYHRSCYRLYNKNEHLGEGTAVEPTLHAGASNADMVKLAFSDFQEHLFRCFFPKKEVVLFNDITKIYVNKLMAHGVTDTVYLKHNLRRNIEKEYGSSIKFLQYNKRTLFIYPDSLTIDDVIISNISLERKLGQLNKNDDNDLYNVASKIRRELKETTSSEEETLHLSLDSMKNANPVPEVTNKFLINLLTGNKTQSELSLRVQRLVWSFSQDLTFAVNEGRVKTPKHILISYALKTLSGRSTELMQILNRCGHSVSPTIHNDIDNGIAASKIAENEERCLVLPKCVQPNVFTHLVWDNIDRLEETLSGGGTSHRVNGIIMQPKVEGPRQEKDYKPLTIGKRKMTPTVTSSQIELNPYNAGVRVGPVVNAHEDLDTAKHILQSTCKNVQWLLFRKFDANVVVPSWTGFNINLSQNKDVVETNVGYLPNVNAPATSLTTVFEILRRSVLIMKKLDLESIVLTFDQALYAKAAEILWKHREEFKCVVLCLGGFHTLCNFMGIIGKRFGDAGLRDVLVEASVIAEGSVTHILSGKQYNRSVRAHKLFYEALMNLAFKKFEVYIVEHETAMVPVLEALHTQIVNAQNSTPNCSVLESEELVQIRDSFMRYLDILRNKNGSLSKFWMSYVDMIEILLMLIRSTRDGNWDMYLSGIRKVLPWCFSYDHLNYARYMPVYLSDMIDLKDTHPDVHKSFVAGNFSVQLGSYNPFGRIPADQTIEETVNKDTQGCSGTKGFSLNHTAVERYYLTADVRASCLQLLRDCTNNGMGKYYKHSDLSKSRIIRDQNDVSSIQNLLECEWINPFDDSRLLCISSGVLADASVEKDLLMAQEKGEESYVLFKKNLCTDDSNIPHFFSTMKKAKLKTFASMTKIKRIQTKDKEIILKADRGMFAHMTLIAQTRQLDMRLVLTHPLGPLPWALATPDGSLRKTCKSSLMKALANDDAIIDVLPVGAAYLIDGMSFVQKVPEGVQTFHQVADMLLKRILSEARDALRIDVVFDVYLETSIKDIERSRRASSPGLLYENVTAAQTIRQWKSFLSEGTNKNTLIKFLVGEWKSESYRKSLGAKEFFVTCGSDCFRLTADSVTDVLELRSNQEEADTKIILHASHAAVAGFENIVVICDDTDVAVLILYHLPAIQVILIIIYV